MKHRGFTIIELLVVIAIIALLISILLPSLAGARERARFTKWAGYSHNLRADPEGIAYWNFQNQQVTDQKVNNAGVIDPNDAAREDLEPKDFDATLSQGASGNQTPPAHANPSSLWANDANVLNGRTRWSGKGGMNFDRNAIGECLYVRHNAYLTPRAGFTVNVWAKKRSNVNYQMYLTKTTLGASGYQLMDLGSGSDVTFRWSSDGNTVQTGAAPPANNPGEWHLISGVFDSVTKQALIYVDGVRCDTPAATQAVNVATAGGLQIGNRCDNTAYNFDGVIDEVGLFKRAMSANELQQWYSVGAKRAR